MDKKNEISKIISDTKEDCYFTGRVGVEKISQIEDALKVTLPESYKWFLSNYGHILIMGIEVFGVSKGDILSCVEATERYRKIGLPEHFVVIENCDEWIYCLDTSRMENGECPVVDWDRIDGAGPKKHGNFCDFFYKQLEEAVEDWEDDWE
ncbi:SMI1/KNR4 family protein [Clostridium sp. DJ247]|uniref:SMI1/KNR4 family protein n=1 Tax=Clostridium sp. DJ247 TaxID=2726188 RepID=UPI001628F1EB|nr:SMI1/KNR4 family protein [Clostridium sp. DJ247]MBC2582565.1 SMI1/KNR4 family protein [Clostridium sp. DJ247]